MAIPTTVRDLNMCLLGRQIPLKLLGSITGSSFISRKGRENLITLDMCFRSRSVTQLKLIEYVNNALQDHDHLMLNQCLNAQ